MAIDFSQVKTITIPEGSVTKITDSTGNTLWQGVGWHTIWEGNVTNWDSNTRITLSNLTGIVKLRVTWSFSISGDDSSYTTTYFNNNGYNPTTDKPDSPFQFDLNADSYRGYIIGVRRYKGTTGMGCYLEWYNSSRYFNLNSLYGGGGTGNVRVSMTITKIEQYY